MINRLASQLFARQRRRHALARLRRQIEAPRLAGQCLNCGHIAIPTDSYTCPDCGTVNDLHIFAV